MDILLPTCLSLALTTAVAWLGSRTVARYVARQRPEAVASPARLRCRTTACCVLLHAVVLTVLALWEVLDDSSGAGTRLVLATLASPVAVLVTLACLCDALCMRLPNLLLGLAAVPLVLVHLLRAAVMASEIADPCSWAWDHQECQVAYTGYRAEASSYWPVLAPLLVAAGLTASLALSARLSRQIGAGDVKLVAVLTFTLAPFTTTGQVYALCLGLGAAGIAAGLRIALGRADRRTPVPLGPYLLGAFTVSWCLAL
ncbi:hypothetical protein [Actinomyces faecalis]|uniref:hypothetical protein n=1 Tax=Actinomyces faecalis TaxID=2722820 RepID=UPI0015556EE3|nr:hypothetical protein [Actinomyces faecalis]